MHTFRSYIQLLLEASEGDAYKYMKKVLMSLPNAEELAADYGENWTREIFNKLRDDFVHSGCDVYFVPGIARILYGELGYDSEDEDSAKVRQLRSIVKFITMAHKEQFNRHLAHINTDKTVSAPFTYEQLRNMFDKTIKQATDAERNNFKSEGKTNYTVIWLKDFETANQYLEYCTADPWCYFEDEETFANYASNGNKLYLALAPGFENLEPGDPGYGRSMIGFDMEPQDENGVSHLGVCNNRYNHSQDLEHENNKSGDNKYNEIELSKILGVPVWKAYPGYTMQELEDNGIIGLPLVKAKIKNIFDNFVSNEQVANDILELAAKIDSKSSNLGMYEELPSISINDVDLRRWNKSREVKDINGFYKIVLSQYGTTVFACYDSNRKKFILDFIEHQEDQDGDGPYYLKILEYLVYDYRTFDKNIMPIFTEDKKLYGIFDISKNKYIYSISDNEEIDDAIIKDSRNPHFDCNSNDFGFVILLTGIYKNSDKRFTVLVSDNNFIKIDDTKKPESIHYAFDDNIIRLDNRMLVKVKRFAQDKTEYVDYYCIDRNGFTTEKPLFSASVDTSVNTLDDDFTNVDTREYIRVTESSGTTQKLYCIDLINNVKLPKNDIIIDNGSYGLSVVKANDIRYVVVHYYYEKAYHVYDIEGNNVYNTGKRSEIHFEDVCDREKYGHDGMKYFAIISDTNVPKTEVSPFNKYMLRDIDGTLLFDKPIYDLGMCYGFMNDKNSLITQVLHDKPTVTYFRVAFSDENDNKKYIQYAILADKSVVKCGTYDS